LAYKWGGGEKTQRKIFLKYYRIVGVPVRKCDNHRMVASTSLLESSEKVGSL
jgi:hypothetical protein